MTTVLHRLIMTAAISVSTNSSRAEQRKPITKQNSSHQGRVFVLNLGTGLPTNTQLLELMMICNIKFGLRRPGLRLGLAL